MVKDEKETTSNMREIGKRNLSFFIELDIKIEKG